MPMDSPLFDVLIVDDEPVVARYLASLLPSAKFRTHIVNRGQDCLEKVQSRAVFPDMILMDAEMPEIDGFATLRELRRMSHDIPVAMMSCFTGPERTFEAWQSGAQAFLQKPILQTDIEKVIAKHCKAAKADAEPAPQQPYIEDFGDGQFFLATSPEMKGIRRQVEMLSKADVPVLITGESGVGKEVVAQLLHRHSKRAGRQLLKVNCAALPADLLESELFGDEARSEEHTSELQSPDHLVCRLLLEKKNTLHFFMLRFNSNDADATCEVLFELA